MCIREDGLINLLSLIYTRLTYWIVHKAVTFVVNKDETGATGVGVDFPHSHNMPELVHVLPVLNEEVIDSPILKINKT